MADDNRGQPPPVSSTSAGTDGVERRYPVSFGQRRVWLLSVLNEGSPEFNVSLAWLVVGSLDVGVLGRALGLLAGRHEVLRTGFVVAGDEPVQVVAPSVVVPVEVVEVVGRSAVAAAVAEVDGQPFDVAVAPLLRVRVVRWAVGQQVLVVVVHHLVFDGWSAGIFAAELGQAYAAVLAGGVPDWSALPVQYGDVAVAERDRAERDGWGESLRYWQDRLAGLEPLQLPTDRSYPTTRSWHGGSLEWLIDGDISSDLKTFCRAHRVTPFMVLVAGFVVVLGRFSGCVDVAVGFPVAGRGRLETEGLLGLFFDTVVLRTDLAGDLSFVELVGRVRAGVLEAFAHQQVPFDRVVEELAPRRDLGRHPLVQVWCEMDNTEQVELVLPGLRCEEFPVPAQAAKFDLSLSMRQCRDGVEVALGYRCDVFEPGTVQRLRQAWLQVLGAGLADPGCPIGRLPLVDRAALGELVRLGQPDPVGAGELGAGGGVLGWFVEWVRRAPDAAALVWDGGRCGWSYAQLAGRAGECARWLAGQGVGPEDRVLVCLPRGPELIAAFLGCWLAGAAYLPVEPGFPVERLGYLLADSQAAAVVTQSRLAGLFPVLERRPVLYLDPVADPEPDPDPVPEVAVDGGRRLAYVIYTSGSTGRPKGVLVEHASLANFIRSCQDRYATTAAGTGAALFSSVAFDAVIPNIFTPLTLGHRLHLLPEDLDPAELATTLASLAPYTFLKLTPAHLELLSHQLPPGRGHRLAHTLVVGAEAFPARTLRDWRRHDRRSHILNEYGPTEATVANSLYLTTAEDSDRDGLLPIGRPIPGSSLYVLDPQLQPLPIGVAGELYIGGDCLARGYQHRPRLTAERFLPDPYSHTPGGRLYRTGDLARLLPDGNYDYLTRTDDQIKIHGFRIEPGEIENTLTQHPDVRTAHVAATHQQLTAWIVPENPTQPPTPDQLHHHVSNHLPQHLRPTHYLTINELPLTPHGKIDRTALPQPGTPTNPNPTHPTTPLEHTLTTIWQQTLNTTTPISTNDNFFTLGGHSLTALKTITRIRNTLPHTHPTLQDLFQHPTITTLAQHLTHTTPNPGDTAPLPDTPRAGRYPVSFGQRRVWLLSVLNEGSPEFNVSLAWLVVGSLDVGVLGRALGLLAGRHEVLRTGFVVAGDEPVQVVAPSVVVPVEVVEVVGRSAVAAAVAEVDGQPFDVAVAPLLRVRVVRWAVGQQVLVVVVHHLVFDGWSAGIFAAELGQAYAAVLAGGVPDWSALPVQYGDVAVAERDRAERDGWGESLRYWQDRLAGLEPLQLPTDRSYPTTRSWHGDTIEFSLPSEIWRLVTRYQERQHGSVTPFMVLVAGFVVVLGRFSGCVDVAVGFPVAGRGRLETEGLLGLFFDTVVLRTDLAGDLSFVELVGRVRAGVLEAFAHQQVPFDRVVEELAPRRDLGRHPLVQVWCEMDNTEQVELVLPGLRCEEFPVPAQAAKFDLSLSMRQCRDGVEVALGYRCDVFEPGTVQRLRQAWLQVLGAGLADPGCPIGRLPLVDRAALGELVRLGQPDPVGAGELGAGGGVLGWFVEWVRRAPDAAALVWDGGRCGWSYAQLAGRAGECARWLAGQGVGPEDRVLVCLPRGPELIAAFLGCWLAGAAYLPVEPGFPVERLGYLLADSQAAAVVTQSRLAGLFPVLERRPVLYLDPVADPEPDPDPVPEVAVDGGRRLAYVIYTSGSTGRPKGVLVEHASLANFIRSCQDRYATTAAGTGAALFSSVAFDAVIPNIFTPLTLGHRLHLLPEDLDPAELATTLASLAPYTFLKLTPAHLELLSHQLPPGRGHRLAHTLVVGAEAFPARTLRDWRRHDRRSHILNEYGPTEATVANSLYLTTAEDSDRDGLLPIGRPIPGSSLYVLDPQLQPLPIGVAGELYIGGDCLARGYQHRPRLTAERFLPDPYSHTPGGRLYRTGDLARLLPDGNYDYLTRTDDQIKIHGFRIEPGEIENTLTQHPDVRTAHVAATHQQLTAWIVPENPTQPPTPDQLHHHVSNHLPQHLRPTHYLTINELPLTPHGKIDRTALPQPGTPTNPNPTHPTTPLEHTLTTIWQQTLNTTTPISTNDNFFTLGGHSLTALKTITRIRNTLPHTHPTLQDLFQHPTITTLAQHLTHTTPNPGTARTRRSSRLLCFREGNGVPLFCIHPSGGSGHWYEPLAALLADDEALYAFHTFGTEHDTEPFPGDVAGLAARYLADLREVAPRGPYRLLGWSLSGVIALEMGRQLLAEGERVEPLLLVEASLVDGYTRLALEPNVESHRRSAKLIKQIEQTRAAGADSTALEQELSRQLASSDVLPDEAQGYADAAVIGNAGLLYEAFLNYRPQPYAGDVQLVVTDECIQASNSHPSKASGTSYAEYLASWQELVAGELLLYRLPGDHMSVLDRSQLPLLVEILYRRRQPQA